MKKRCLVEFNFYVLMFDLISHLQNQLKEHHQKKKKKKPLNDTLQQWNIKLVM